MQYVPLLPVLLLNGAAGIGTGWSTLVPRCHPVQVLDNVVACLEGRPMALLLPWSPGFHGTVEPTKVGANGEVLRVLSRGVAEVVDEYLTRTRTLTLSPTLTLTLTLSPTLSPTLTSPTHRPCQPRPLAQGPPHRRTWPNPNPNPNTNPNPNPNP